jgi:hypothetical protein
MRSYRLFQLLVVAVEVTQLLADSAVGTPACAKFVDGSRVAAPLTR